MIGGIFETIGKTLGAGKEKYFLELDDAAEDVVKGIEKATSTAADVAKDVADSAKATAERAAAKGEVTAAAAKAQEVAENVGESAASVGDVVNKKVKSAAKAPAQKAAQATKNATVAKTEDDVAAAPTPALPPAPDPEEIIVKAIAAGSRKRNGQAVGPNGEPQTFSTDYLMPQKKMRRRRPGPSLGTFKGMAKDVNPRLK